MDLKTGINRYKPEDWQKKPEDWQKKPEDWQKKT